MKLLQPIIYTALMGPCLQAYAQTTEQTDKTLPSISVSADATSEGLSPAFAGGQVAKGGRAGILGTHDNLDTPFSITSYTNDLIKDKQAHSVGDVLQNDSGVRVARGFGNFQESYFIRGFILNSDDVAYNGLYSLLPRQYIATELFERVEVLHGASAFLNGVNPGGGGIGGAINLVPKRALNDPLNSFSASGASGGQGGVSADISRRFGENSSTGLRFNVAHRSGGTAIDDEKVNLDLASVAWDWHSDRLRLSADLGYQNNKLRQTRPNVSIGAGVSTIPTAPNNSVNFAQPWSYSNEEDTFGTFRAEMDLSKQTTSWLAYGMRRSNEANSLANLDLTNANGTATTSRFDNTREDTVDTGEIGLRTKLQTGPIQHSIVASYSMFRLDKKAAYTWDYFNTLATNLYNPTAYSTRPNFTATAFTGNDLNSPARTGLTRLSSVALGDQLSMLKDTLNISLGLRQQRFNNSDYAYGTSAETNYTRTRTSPLAGVVYKMSPTTSVYGNYVEGLSPGETAPSFGTPTPPVNAGQTLAPYVSKQKEVGIKYESRGLGTGLSFFSTTKPRSIINSSNVFTSEGEDKHQGVEWNVYGEPKQGVKLLGGVTWLDTEQVRTGSASTEGKRVIGVPKVQANLGAEFEVKQVQGMALDARVIYTGSQYADAANTLKVPDWTRLDLGARWYINSQNKLTTLRLRLENATNENYWSSVGGYPGNGYLVVGTPRTLVLSASLDF